MFAANVAAPKNEGFCRRWIVIRSSTESNARSSTSTPIRANYKLIVISLFVDRCEKRCCCLGEAEGKLCTAIIDHYDTLIPKIEAEFREVYDNMDGVNDDVL